jgi:hypothetical protein
MSKPMRPGEARIGQRVITLRAFADWPDVPVGTVATIKAILSQNSGSETDAITIRPHIKGYISIACESSDVELMHR